MANQKSSGQLNNQTPTEIWVPVTTKARKKRPFVTILFFITFLALCLGSMLAATAVAFIFVTGDIILPGVSVLGIDIGLQSRTAAAEQLQNAWREQTVTLTAGDSAWVMSPDELGMLLDSETTVDNAYQLGRSVNSVMTLPQSGLAVAPVWTFDTAVAASALESLTAEIAVAPVDAGLQVQGNSVSITPPQEGQALDVAATLAELNQLPALVLQNGALPLITRAVAPSVSVADVTPVVTEIESFLGQTLTIDAFDPISNETHSWILPPDEWHDWVTIGVDPAAAQGFHWSLEPQSAAVFFASQAETLGAERYVDMDGLVTAVSDALAMAEHRITTRIYHHPRQHVVQPGESMASIGYDYGIPYPWLQQANPEIATLTAGQTITIPSFDEMLPLPVINDKRVVVNISEQRAQVFEDGQLKWDWPASTGIDSSPTAPGIFQIQTHEPTAYASNWDLWMPSFMGIYRPVPTSDFMNGFHGFPTRGNSQLLWTGDLGHKVTYGCVLLSSENAAALYDWAEEGVVVEIQP